MLFGQCPHGGGDKLKGASLTDVGTNINLKSWGQSDSATWIETSVGLGTGESLGTETSVGLGTFREIFRLSDPTTCNSD